MKYLVAGFILFSGVVGFVACSGTVEDADEGGEQSSSDLCGDVCRETATCFGDSGSGLSTQEILRQCREDCLDGLEDTRRAGCESVYEGALECLADEWSCRGAYGSGDSPCEREITRYVRCMSSSEGSGYYSDEGS